MAWCRAVRRAAGNRNIMPEDSLMALFLSALISSYLLLYITFISRPCPFNVGLQPISLAWKQDIPLRNESKDHQYTRLYYDFKKMRQDTTLESAADSCTYLAGRMKTPNSFIQYFCFFVYLIINRYQLFKRNLIFGQFCAHNEH